MVSWEAERECWAVEEAVLGGGRRRKRWWEGVVFVLCGSSSVERAHNLSNEVWPLGDVEAEEPKSKCVLFLSNKGISIKGKEFLDIEG